MNEFLAYWRKETTLLHGVGSEQPSLCLK